MIQANELRIGNRLQFLSGNAFVVTEHTFPNWDQIKGSVKPIPLDESWLIRAGFSVINESSAGKKYGYVIKGVFSSDLTFIFWKTTENIGKIFRWNLEIKHVHQLQNLFFALTGTELTFKDL